MEEAKQSAIFEFCSYCSFRDEVDYKVTVKALEKLSEMDIIRLKDLFTYNQQHWISRTESFMKKKHKLND